MQGVTAISRKYIALLGATSAKFPKSVGKKMGSNMRPRYIQFRDIHDRDISGLHCIEIKAQLFMNFNSLVDNAILVALFMQTVTPLRTQWSYRVLALMHQFDVDMWVFLVLKEFRRLTTNDDFDCNEERISGSWLSMKTLLTALWAILTLNVRGPSYLSLTRSISWLLMPWLLNVARTSAAMILTM